MKMPVPVQVSFWVQLALLVPGLIKLIPNALAAKSVFGGPVFFVVFSLLTVALWVWVAIRTRQGRRGFRMFLTVVTGLSVVIGVVNLATGIYGFGWDAYVVTLLQIGVVVLLWLPESRRYFDTVRDQRREAAALREAEQPVKPYLDPDNR